MSEDRVLINDLMVRGILGVNEWERHDKQDILINIVLFADVRDAAVTDQVENSVNYRTVTKGVIELVESSARLTAEALAEDIARVCFREERLKKVRVRVEKPGAVRFARSVGVEIERRREDLA